MNADEVQADENRSAATGKMSPAEYAAYTGALATGQKVAVRCHRCKKAYLTAAGAAGCSCPKRVTGDNPISENPWAKSERLEKESEQWHVRADHWEGEHTKLEKELADAKNERDKQIEQVDHWYKESCRLGEELNEVREYVKSQAWKKEIDELQMQRDQWIMSFENLHDKLLQTDATLAAAKQESAKYYAQVKEMDKSVAVVESLRALLGEQEALVKAFKGKAECLERDVVEWKSAYMKMVPY